MSQVVDAFFESLPTATRILIFSSNMCPSSEPRLAFSLSLRLNRPNGILILLSLRWADRAQYKKIVIGRLSIFK